MPKRQQLLHSLTRKRVRSSFNKFNLYNAMTWRKILRRGTMFQQKFTAKQETRSYHGEKLTETQWRNVFTGELNGVNPLRSTKQAADAEGAAGETPWALQTYLPMERRLDTALFRSFFASSPRQAAQFIVKGKVKVNGVKIRSPGYELKAGDMFSVDPESVLFALGRRKPSIDEAVKLTNRQITKYNKYIARCKKYPLKMWRLRQHNRAKHSVYNKLYEKKHKKRVEEQNAKLKEEMKSQLDQLTPSTVLGQIVKSRPFVEKYGTLPLAEGTILNKSLSVFRLVEGKGSLSGADAAKGAKKSAIKSFGAFLSDSDVKPTVDKYYGDQDGPANKGDVKKLVQEIIKLKHEEIVNSFQGRMRKEKNFGERYDPKWVQRLPSENLPLVDAEAAKEDASAVGPIRLPFSDGKLYGLSDPSKQYFTPWNPRPFLAPFAVLPHHIEISFKTCHAVYLRDPVARPGHSEIISPFPLDMHERAYMFYVRKRRKNL